MPKFDMYSPMRGWKHDLPADPLVAIAVGDHMATEGGLMLTGHLMSDQEIDYAIDELISELQSLRKAAKAELRARKAEMLAR